MMRGNKTAIYRNSLGRELIFDNCGQLYLESIDMTGVSGIHTVESLAGADGQQTIESHLAARTIPCSFALLDPDNNGWIRRELAQIFSPLLNGTLTVYTKFDKYEIDVRPTNNPVFRMGEVDCVWRFDVDFVADYPLWRVGAPQVRTVPIVSISTSTETIIRSDCAADIPPDIIVPAYQSSIALLQERRSCFYLGARNYDVKINTRDFRVTKLSDGSNCSQLIDSNYDLSAIRLKYGDNTFKAFCTSGSGGQAIEFRYSRLSLGEV